VTWRRLTEPELPWLVDHAGPAERAAALAAYCEATLGFTPLAHIDLDVPLAGVTGVAFVLPSAASPTSSGAHRVYLKRMLLGPRVDGVLPEWAFFVRCVLNSTGLRPTASREQLYDDDVLLGTRDALGREVHTWLSATLATPGRLRTRFLDAHHLAVRALALTDDTMLATAATVLPYETTEGVATLADVVVETVGKRIDPLPEANPVEDDAHVVIRRVTITDSDIAGDRTSEEKRPIVLVTDNGSESNGICVAQINPAQCDNSLIGIAETAHHVGQRGLAGTGLTNNSDPCTGPNGEIDRAEDPIAARSNHGHPLNVQRRVRGDRNGLLRRRCR